MTISWRGGTTARRVCMNIFYNSKERRLRVLWRILLCLAAPLGVLLGVSLVGGLVGGILTAVNVIDWSWTTSFQAALASRTVETGPLAAAAVLASSSGLMVLLIVPTVIFAVRTLDRQPLAILGFRLSRRWWRDLAVGVGLSAAVMGLVFAFESAAGLVTSVGPGWRGQSAGDWLGGMGLAFLGFAAVSLTEEISMRGYLLPNLAAGCRVGKAGPRAALLAGWLISSMVFGVLHAWNDHATFQSTLNLVVAGFALGLPFVLTGELAIPLGLHLGWNFFQGNVFGFPVSGMASGTSLISIRQGGPDWLTGGAFGPEAGVIGLAALVLQTTGVILWLRREGRTSLREELAAPPPAPRCAETAPVALDPCQPAADPAD
jgi:membrane protease YdiL (CAAX protease family)